MPGSTAIELGVRRLPTVTAAGAAQMAIDEALLRRATAVTARRYLWSPPALSLGKFQQLGEEPRGLPFEVVRRPSGGRAVLHGTGFEWSFAVVFPRGSLPASSVGAAYQIVSDVWAAVLRDAGVGLDESREEPYRHSALCFATSLRYDLHAGAAKVVAVAQARRSGAVLVHGSVLERRPPLELTAAAERLLGEPWRGEGLLGAGAQLDGGALWEAVLRGLAAELACSAGALPAR